MVDWRQRNATFFNALQVERNVMFLILTLIVLVAALNIISGLIMLVKDKGADIAILRTMGATQGAVMRIFLITGASIGVVGTIVGFLLGTLVCLNVESIRQFLSWLTSDRAVPARALFPVAAAGRDGSGRDHRGGRDGADAVAAGDALSVLARGAARSGRGAALRMTRAHRGRTAKPPTTSAPILFLHGIERHYRQGDATLEILKGAELALWPGQSVALVAPSGAGKSTLLHIAGLLEHPDAGEVYVDQVATSHLADAQRTAHPPHRDRLRLSVPPPAAGVLGARERDAAADDPRACRARKRRSRAAELLDLSRPAGSA